MIDETPTTPSVIRLATPGDIENINALDRMSTSPTRDIHRDMEKYFGSVDPSTHELTLIFLAQVEEQVAGKAELMVAPASDEEDASTIPRTGYVKRVIINPAYRKMGLARQLMEHIIYYARTELSLTAIDLHVWEENIPAIRLYESLGFEVQHRELYFHLSL
ncbi:MAG TPA: GNAT family N-acetyltransferase [Ktedonobacteraceae bacterium]|nr:GNAT family N-acetyltransferase [Ktedonobacteraceae bacterium]